MVYRIKKRLEKKLEAAQAETARLKLENEKLKNELYERMMRDERL